MNDPRKMETLDVFPGRVNYIDSDGMGCALVLACVSVALAVLALACDVYGVTW